MVGFFYTQEEKAPTLLQVGSVGAVVTGGAMWGPSGLQPEKEGFGVLTKFFVGHLLCPDSE